MAALKIAVLGGSNGGFAMAADLSLQGHEVRFWSRSSSTVEPLLETRKIKISGPLMKAEAELAHVTTDISKAVKGADLLCSPLPAFAQPYVAGVLGPHLTDGQVIFLPPGSFGTVLMADHFRKHGLWRNIALAETGTLPYLARKKGPNEIGIVVRACHLPTGVFPAKDTDWAIERIHTAFPPVHPVENALSGALMNAGPAIHSPLIVLNTGPIEHPAPYDIHNEGTTPGIRKVIRTLDHERILVREVLGFKPNHYPLEDYFDDTRPNEWMYPRTTKKLLIESGFWREEIGYHHRYVTEDIACGLTFLVSVADYAGVEVPAARSLLILAGIVAGIDYIKEGRTLGSLGLSSLSKAELFHLLEQGWE
jgi:opine dehydrogenase